MLKFVELSENNIEKYDEIIPPEHLTELSRELTRGLVGEDESTGEVLSAIFWEIKNAEREAKDTMALIHWFSAKSKDAAELILKEFVDMVHKDSVKTCYFEIESLKDHEIDAFQQSGFDIRTAEGMRLFLTIKELVDLPLTKKPPQKYVKPLSEISIFQFKAGIMSSVFHGRYGILDDLPFLPMNRYDLELSSCVLTDDKVTGMLLVRRVLPNLYTVELLFSEKMDASINVLNMLRHSIHVAKKICDLSDRVLIHRHHRRVTALMDKLFPGKKGVTVLKGVLRIKPE